jgi:hypothetical protein
VHVPDAASHVSVVQTFPSSHEHAVHVAAPSSLCVFAGHASHAIDPLVAVKVPAAHGMHVAVPIDGAIDPGAQRRHDDDPSVSAYVPVGQAVHAS